MDINIDHTCVSDALRIRRLSNVAVPLAGVLIVTAYASCILQLAGLH